MDRNARRRKRNAEIPHEQKEEMLRRRREAYALKKKSTNACSEIVTTTEKERKGIMHLKPTSRTEAVHIETDVSFSHSHVTSENEASSPRTQSSISALCYSEETMHEHQDRLLPCPIQYSATKKKTDNEAIGCSPIVADAKKYKKYRLRYASRTRISRTETIALPANSHVLGHESENRCNNASLACASHAMDYQIESSHDLQSYPSENEPSSSTTPSKIQLPCENEGKRRKIRRSRRSLLESIPNESLILPDVPNCQHCGAKRFHLESANFCCSLGEISLVCPPMPYDLYRLFTNQDEESVEFRRNVRTYNNTFAFTSLGAKYDKELVKNTKGIYTFRVQGQVYHFLDGIIVSDDNKPSGIQLYFYDTEEEVSHRLHRSPKLSESTIRLIMRILAQNPYARFFKDLRDVPDITSNNIVLSCYPGLDQRVYNLPSVSQVAAIWTEVDGDDVDKRAHIQVYTHSNISHRIQHYYACYDPLQYPLLFPRGESGWHHGIKRVIQKGKKNQQSCNDEISINPSTLESAAQLLNLENTVATRRKNDAGTISAREYYCYKLQIREDDRYMLLHVLRLLQQFVVDVYIKIETARLDFHRKKQNEIRTEALAGLMDSVSIGENRGCAVGRKVILPASFIGGPRDMRRRYIDAMAIVQKYGKPDIFLTMTCNPMWKEIQDNLKYEEKPQDRPDLLSRVFRAKFEMLKQELLNKKIFGDIVACVYVVEFQKRGLPHAHLLLILKPEFKPLNPEAYDLIVSAEIPDPTEQSHLFSLVIKHMMHGPCGSMNVENPCMRNGICKNHYPKDFCNFTTHSDDGYPHYRRRNNGRVVRVRNHNLDNRWVVPYNPYLLAQFDCHLNVEICSTVKLVKYLYKYVFKGHDHVRFHVMTNQNDSDVDEIKEFQSGRWISPPEAVWHIFRFLSNHMQPSVYTLQIHLSGHQLVSFQKNTDIRYLVRNLDFSRTMLTEFFEMNRANKRAQHLKLLYREFPQHFVWSSASKLWSQRKRGHVIGRMVTVSPTEGERYYLRLLLSHVRAPTSFDDLLTVDGSQLDSYRDAALQLGLLSSDTHITDCLEEAASFQMPSSLRLLFAILLAFCSPNDPRNLWEKFEPEFSRDFQRSQAHTRYSLQEIRRKVLQDINRCLEQMGKSIDDYHLTTEKFELTGYEQLTRELESEKSIQISEEDLLMHSKLNPKQKNAYEDILCSVYSHEGQAYFIDGPGGTGKTFLYRCLLATLRSQGYIAIAVATSGVAASILPGGRTAHSRFKIPLDFSVTKSCQLSKQSSVSKLLAEAKLIIWDEASMAKREAIEAFEILLRDILSSDLHFGGKVVVFGGDFRQTLPVMDGATREMQISASLVNSPLWGIMKKIHLTENMRALLDPCFSHFLLRIGEGKENVDEDDNILLPPQMVIPYTNKDMSLNRFIQSVFKDLGLYSRDPYQMINRCILTPKNSSVDDLNQMLIDQFPGNLVVYTSTDRTLDARHQEDYEDFLNSLNPKGLPPHKLLLKENCPIILLRNLNPTEGLCNGTRLICRELRQHNISAEIAVGQHKGKKILLPRIPLQSPDNEKNGIPFKRTQFPIRLCFAMTINKAQGQTLDYVGIYLREPVFSHGQLYVALSRATTGASLKVLILPPTLSDEKDDCKTKNIVYEEVLQLAKQ